MEPLSSTLGAVNGHFFPPSPHVKNYLIAIKAIQNFKNNGNMLK